MSLMTSLNITINEENEDLPTFYWLPKLQKNSYEGREIVQQLSIVMTKQCLQSYCDSYSE